MNDELKALQEAIKFNREQLVEALLQKLAVSEIEEELFSELVKVVGAFDEDYLRLVKAYDAQEVIDRVLKNKLQ